MGEQGIALEHDAEIPLVDGNLGEVLAIEEEGTPIGFNKTGDHPQGGCFSAAGGPQKGDEFALLNVQAQVVENLLFSVVGDVDILQLDKRHSSSSYRWVAFLSSERFSDCRRNENASYKTIINVPAVIRAPPIHAFMVGCSWRNTNASTSVMTTLNLSTGTTLEASPICKAL